jgi:hypothetical protein
VELCRNGYILQQSYRIAFNGVMDVWFVQVLYQFGKMFLNKRRVIDQAITYGPGCPLHYAVFIIQKEFEQFIKALLVAANPFYDLIGLRFGMLCQYGFPEIHDGKVMG